MNTKKLAFKKTAMALTLATACVSCAFATAYTWTGAGTPNADGSLNWSDGANWGVATAAFPGRTAAGANSSKDTATFPAGTTANVLLDVSTTIATLTASGSGTRLTFSSEEGCLLTLTGAFTLGASGSSGNADSVVTLDGASITASASTTYVASGLELRLVNAASLRLKALRLDSSKTAYAGRTYVGGRSSLLLVDTGTCICIGGNATLTIDDATVAVTGNAYVNDNSSTGGGRIVIKGAHPLLTVAGTNFRSENNASRTRGADFDFIVPVGGFPEAPIQHLGSTQAFLSGADTCTVPMRFNILAESPALAGGTSCDTPLASSQLAIDTSLAALSSPYPGIVKIFFDAPGTGLFAHLPNLARIVTIVTEPAFMGGIMMPASGYENLATGTNLTLSAVPVTTAYGVATPRGVRLYDVNPTTGARTEVAGSPFLTGASYPYTHPGNWREVRWLWSWSGEGDVFVSTLGDDANDGLSWDSAKLTLGSALSAAADDALILFGDGTFDIASNASLSRPITVASLNGRDKTTLFGHFEARMISMSDAGAAVRGLTFASDYADGTYGCLAISAGLFTDCAIRDFYTGLSKVSGSAISMSGGVVTNCVMSHNYLRTSGGSGKGAAVYMTGGTLVNCEVVGNIGSSDGAANYGGTIRITSGTVRNCLVARNSVPNRTSGIYATGGTIENCTIVSNRCTSTTAYGGIYASGATFRNCIIYGNRNANGICEHTLGSNNSFSNCCCPDELDGDGNIVTPPEFADETAGDYRLVAGPCIDGGANQPWMEGAEDLDGRARVVGDSVDIGCYEYFPSALVAAIVPSALYGVESATVDFSYSAKGTNTTGLVCSWAFEDAGTFDVVDSDSATVSHTYSSPGRYSVRLLLRNSAGEVADVVAQGLITVSPAVVYVAYDSANPVFPYGSPETAAAHIEDALDVAGDGVLVRVAAGTNVVPAKVVVQTSTRIRGEGPEKTFFTSAGGSHPIFSLGNTDIVLDSMTIYGSQGGGVYIRDGGTLTNCVVRDNYCSSVGGAGIQMYNTALVVDSIISGNQLYVSAGTTRTGGGILANGSNCRLERCAITDNWIGTGSGVAGSAVKAGTGVHIAGAVTMRNCLVARNYNWTTDTGAYAAVGVTEGSAIIENCTIVSNRISAASDRVAGLYIVDSAAATVRNCIVADNVTGSSVSNMFAGVKAKVYATYDHVMTDEPYAAKLNANVASGSHRGGGNFGGDPCFRNVAAGDYHLRMNSPAHDAGAEAAWMAGATDLDGRPRFFGKAPDVGCYEIQTGAGTVLMIE